MGHSELLPQCLDCFWAEIVCAVSRFIWSTFCHFLAPGEMRKLRVSLRRDWSLVTRF